VSSVFGTAFQIAHKKTNVQNAPLIALRPADSYPFKIIACHKRVCQGNPVKLPRSGLLVVYIKLKWFTGTEPRNWRVD